jgi:putative transposase
VIFAAIADWADSKEYPVTFMCAELGVSRSGYYAWRNAVASQHDTQDQALIAVMRHLHAQACGNPGVRRPSPGPAGPGDRLVRLAHSLWKGRTSTLPWHALEA